MTYSEDLVAASVVLAWRRLVVGH